ncbi:MAG: hypothetical protein GJV46_00540 [Geobacter sp.]|nr:hypothetical protein [Geobacter sp.]
MKYTNLFDTRIQKTSIEDHSEIMSVFITAFRKEPNLEIQLINYYKGMPLSFNARISRIENGTLELKVYPQQAVAISDDHYTFIRSKLFKYDIVAKAFDVDIRQKTVSLRDLSYVEICAERRNHIRLRVNPPIDALYTTSQGTVRGEIIELSTAGAIMAVDYTVDIGTFEGGKLLFKLPESDHKTFCHIKVPARIITVMDISMPLHFIFSIAGDKTAEKNIAKYLFNRQIEIIRMLKDGCDIG